jgi:hypothetical protein
MSALLRAWDMLAARAEGSLERLVAELLKAKGLSSVAEACGVDDAVVHRWVLTCAVPERHEVALRELGGPGVAVRGRDGKAYVDNARHNGRWAEYRRRAAAGERVVDIAEAFDVTKQSVWRAIDHEKKRREPTSG